MERSQLDGAFEIKEVEESGIFKGYGSTFGGKGDSYNHVVMPGAFAETLKKNGHNGMGIACLWQHRSDEPIGIWQELMEDKKGLKVTGQLIREVPTGDKAYHLLKQGAVRGLSIGYDTIVYEDDAKKKLRYLKEIDLWEISLVTFPANPKASITVVKQLLNEIEQAKTERELENILRDSKQFSKNEAQKIISLCKASLRDSGTVGESGLLLIANSLKQVNEELEIFGQISGEPDEGKPYPNEHACRLEDPGQFDRFARKNCYKKSDGKCIDYIFGIKGGKSTLQAMRYDKVIWTAGDARSHCKGKGGSFEAAKKEDGLSGILDTLIEVNN